MGFFDFLRDFVDFLEDAWNEFISWLGDLVSKVIRSITKWLDLLSNSLKVFDIIITTGSINYRISNRKLTEELKRRKIKLEQKTEKEQAAILRSIAKQAAEDTHNVPLTQQEKNKWEQATGNQEKVYQITNY